MFNFFLKNIERIKHRILTNPPSLTMLVLNWNRLGLLKKTVSSLLATTPGEWKLIIVDNNSTDGSREWINDLAGKNPRVIFQSNKENLGGEALNPVLSDLLTEFVLISENDLEYNQGWYLEMLAPFYIWPKLGQISPFSPHPSIELGEVWSTKPFRELRQSNHSILEALGNLGTTSLVRGALIRRGLRWKNIESADGKTKLPSDGEFSGLIKSKGFFAAWSKTPQVINWGHAPSQWEQDSEYYLKNWKAKSQSNIDGLNVFQDLEKKIKTLSDDKAIEMLLVELGKSMQETEALKTRQIEFQRQIVSGKSITKLNFIEETTRIYFKGRNGYSSESQVVFSWNPYSGEFSKTFQIQIPTECQELRWDPLEGALIRLKIYSLQMQIENRKESIEFNELIFSSHKKDEGWINFTDTDPMIKFSNKELSGKVQLKIEGNLAFI